MTRTIDHVDTLRNSVKFRQWRVKIIQRKTKSSKFLQPQSHARDSVLNSLRLNLMEEKHYKPEELADLWGVSTETIRSIFRAEDGVLKIGKTGSKYRRGYVTLRIPEGVAERVHRKLSA